MNSNQTSDLHKNIFANIGNFDLFRHPFRFQLPNGFSFVTSFSGICATFTLVVLTIAYGTINFIELSDYGKSTIRLDEIDYYFGERDIFDLDKQPGLNIAFGITYYDSNAEPIDDLDIGEVIGQVKSWDNDSGSKY